MSRWKSWWRNSKRFRALTDSAVDAGKITEEGVESFYKNYRANIKSYTYFAP